MQINYEKLTGEWVQSSRKSRGWTQEELAERMRELGEPIHPTAITRLEKGKRAVRLNEWMAFVAVFREPGDDRLAEAQSVESFFDYVRTVTEFGGALEVEINRIEQEPPSAIEVAQTAENIVGIAHMMLVEALRRERGEGAVDDG